MSSIFTHNRRNRGRWSLAGIALASLAVHALIIATAGFGVGTRGEEFAGGEADEEGALVAVEYQFSCWGDASLALGAKALSCSLPGMQSEGCERKALENYRFDLILCDGLKPEDEVAAEAVAYMSEAEIEQIESLPLLDIPELDELEAAQLLQEEIQEKVEEAQEKISDPRQAGQVIEVTTPELEATPDRARFLSEFDTSVEKETVARGSTEEMVNKPAPKDLPIAEDPEELPEDPKPAGEESEELVASESTLEEGTSDEGVGDRAKEAPLLAMRAQEFRAASTAGELTGADALEANGLAAKKGEGASDQEAQRAREGREASAGGSGARRALPNLLPSEETLARLAGGGSVDKLDGVESGDFTALNSKKWKFASFFNRMKRQVAQNWHPDQVYVRRDPTGKVYGTKDRVTVLEVSLKPNGSLAKVVVFKESGVDFLDSEAINAFQKAQPFPNPPAGLVDSGSQLITFSFGFHFQVGARRDAWKIFRYN